MLCDSRRLLTVGIPAAAILAASSLCAWEWPRLPRLRLPLPRLGAGAGAAAAAAGGGSEEKWPGRPFGVEEVHARQRDGSGLNVRVKQEIIVNNRVKQHDVAAGRPASRGGSDGAAFRVAVVLEENSSVVLPSGAEVVDATLCDESGLKISVKQEVQYQCASGNTSVYALRELYAPPKWFRMSSLEITYKLASAPTTEPSRQRPPGVTVLAQIGNTSMDRWADLMHCMSQVSLAMRAEGHGFSVFLTFQENISSKEMRGFELDARRAFGSGAVRSIRVQNRGADIGPYLRQLQVLSGQSPRAVEILNVPEDSPFVRSQRLRGPEAFDTFLKVHSKSDRSHRRRWLRDLCGDVEKVRHVYSQFKRSKSLGMVGASAQVVQYPQVTGRYQVWGHTDIDAMKRTWKMMQPCVPFDIPMRVARIIAGSFYWARPDAVMYQIILHSTEKLIESMPSGYKTRSTGQTSHALERLMPTMAVAVCGLDVVSVDELGSSG
ncbi:unnamed protein product [Prorocentrum cordatum]|uniref:Uncharacterized protein n=1 Tax=Prorocentrum cordatum TaxID=2364126 RepID=A0ABN9WSK4_9DINO|nr:unnamed protein product [Polarella glacialis]